MKPDLLGYVLNALPPDAQRDADAYLQDHPEAQSDADKIRETLAPLSWDPQPHVPPGLSERTLARIAELSPPHDQSDFIGIRGFPWRRVLEVAALSLICGTALGLGLSWVGTLRNQLPGGAPNPVQVVACKDNLHKLFVSLQAYGDMHNRQFPNALAISEPPRNVADVVFAVLQENGLLGHDVSHFCPPLPGGATPAAQPFTYSYSIGYRQGDQVFGPRLEDGKPNPMMPLMADSSPRDPEHGKQSLNHGGAGQNVLYYDGHVAFCQSRLAGVNSDDIYLNRAKKVAAGIDWSDAVLTSGTPPR